MSRSLANSVLVLLVAAVCFVTPGSQAQTHPTYRTSVPFDFSVDDVMLPAGAYEIVQLSPHALRFRALGSHKTADLLVFPIQEDGKGASGKLLFHRYGTLRFLREFSPTAESGAPHTASRCTRTRGEALAARATLATRNGGNDGPIEEVAINSSTRY